MNPMVRQLYFDLQNDLDRICRRFKKPKVTLIVRAPDLADGDVVIGNDELDDAIAAINKLKNRAPFVKPSEAVVISCPDCAPAATGTHTADCRALREF